MKKLLLLSILTVSAGLSAADQALLTPPAPGNIGEYAGSLFTYLKGRFPEQFQGPKYLQAFQYVERAIENSNSQVAYVIFKETLRQPYIASLFADFCAESGYPVLRQMPAVAAGNDSSYITALLQYYLGFSPNSAITKYFVTLNNQDTYDMLFCLPDNKNQAIQFINKAKQSWASGMAPQLNCQGSGYWASLAAGKFAQFAGDVKTWLDAAMQTVRVATN